MSAATTHCFLCSPDPSLVYTESDRFFAMLGHGPLGEGYSLLAAKEHVPSLFDVEADVIGELTEFTAAVRTRIEGRYGPSLMTEHGRVPVCVTRAVSRHEPHCLHAHRLVFPGQQNLDLVAAMPDAKVECFASFGQAWHRGPAIGEYLYVEEPDSTCQVGQLARPIPRQFFRYLIAARLGDLAAADWRRLPNLELVCRAQRTLVDAA